jgi:hypothetical protein
MLEQVKTSTRRLGQSEEQVGAYLRQMDSDLQLKRAEAFLASGNLDRADEILHSGELRPVEAEALTDKLTGKRLEQAFTLLASLPEDQRLEAAQPEKLAEFGLSLDEKQTSTLKDMLLIQQEQDRRAIEAAREQYEKGALAGAIRAALGLARNGTRNGERPGPDPAAAYRMLQEADIDESIRAEALAALKNGTLDRDDPGLVLAMQNRITGGGAVTDVELIRAVACGKLSVDTEIGLEKLRKEAKGPRGGMLGHAFRMIDTAFGANTAFAATPELNTAQLKAREEAMRAILGAESDQLARKMVDVNSPESILPGVVEWYREDTEAQLLRDFSGDLAPLLKAAGHGSVKGVNEAINLVYELGAKLREIGPEWADYSMNLDFTGDGLLPKISWDKGGPKGRLQIPQPFDEPETIPWKDSASEPPQHPHARGRPTHAQDTGRKGGPEKMAGCVA